MIVLVGCVRGLAADGIKPRDFVVGMFELAQSEGKGDVIHSLQILAVFGVAVAILR